MLPVAATCLTIVVSASLMMMLTTEINDLLSTSGYVCVVTKYPSVYSFFHNAKRSLDSHLVAVEDSPYTD